MEYVEYFKKPFSVKSGFLNDMNVDYLNENTLEDENKINSLSIEIKIILITCHTIVSILIICLLSVFCYDCIHSIDEESSYYSS